MEDPLPLLEQAQATAQAVMEGWQSMLDDIETFHETLGPAHEVDDPPAANKPRAARQRRGNIVSEALDPLEHAGGDEQRRVFPKSDRTRELVTSALQSHFLFSDLKSGDLREVVDAMPQLIVVTGKTIVQQGDEGDLFYVLESGSVDVEVDGRRVGGVGEGDAFGELALLYNCPRSATLRALESCVLWTLERTEFRRLLAVASSTKTAELTQFLSNVPLLHPLSSGELGKVATALQTATFADGELILRQGDEGDAFYLIREGRVRCTQTVTDDGGAPAGERELITLGSGDYFGERALLTNEPRAANVVAVGSVDCYTLDRHDFTSMLGPLRPLLDSIMGTRVLKSVPFLSQLPESELLHIAEQMWTEEFLENQCVITEGHEGNTFYVVKDGEASVVQWSNSLQSNVELGRLSTGHYFGERALVTNEARKASVVAVSPRLQVMVLSRDAFYRLIGAHAGFADDDAAAAEAAAAADAAAVAAAAAAHPEQSALETLSKVAAERARRAAAQLEANRQSESVASEEWVPSVDTPLEQLTVLRVLGMGTFGVVKLVRDEATGQVLALKCLQKARVVAMRQQRNVMTEKEVLAGAQHPFVLGLKATYHDMDQLYMLFEFVQGGELWTLLYESADDALGRGPWGGITLQPTVFYTATVVLALHYLHGRGYAYRDLKPENLLVDDDGYLKVVDMGFCKRVPFARDGAQQEKTFTLCGTPEYLAPEIVLSKGHDKAVDFWALGILVYEMLCGKTPFTDERQPKLFEKIVHGQTTLTFPRGFDPHAKSLVRRLLNPNPVMRLGNLRKGFSDLQQHRFFSANDVDWAALAAKELPAPYLPVLESEVDSSAFGEVDVPPEYASVEEFRGGSEWCESF